METKKAFWISYDLGLKGDYSGLYAWLDTVGAIECGDSMAFFKKEYSGNIIESIKDDIGKYAKLSKSDRVYLIHLDNTTNKMKGKFLFGGRKRAPWEGYSNGIENIDEDE